MNGVSMMRFVYISEDYRLAWQIYVEDKFDHWEDWSDDFKEELNFKFKEEQHWIRLCSRPSTWFLNDQLGEHEFVFNMSQKHGHDNKYEYTENLPRFKDILMNKTNNFLGKVTNYSALVGLSSPLAGLKNLLIQIPRSMAVEDLSY